MMEISKIISMIHWSRLISLTVMLWLMFQFGLFTDIPPNSLIRYANPLSAFVGAALLAWAYPPTANSLWGRIWNKITPIKNKATIIEGEIVYILPILTITPIYMGLIFNLGVGDIVRLLPIIGLAALPGSTAAYIIQVINKDAIIAASKQTLNELENESDSEDSFYPDTLHIIAYTTASLTFNILLTILSSIIIYFKVGLHSPLYMKILPLIGLAALIMSVFGRFLLQEGLRMKDLLGFNQGSVSMSITLGWFLSLTVPITILTAAVNLNKIPTTYASLIAASPYILTYVLFALSALVSGFILSRFYTPKHISTVFA